MWLLMLFPHLMLLLCGHAADFHTGRSMHEMWLAMYPLRMRFLVASSSILQYASYASSMLSIEGTGRMLAVTSTSLSNSGKLVLRKFHLRTGFLLVG